MKIARPVLSDRDASAVPLILASASAGRAAVLRDAGLDFQQMPASVDERAIEANIGIDVGVNVGVNAGDVQANVRAEHVAVRLAEEKALAISRQRPDAIVIGADQVMSCDGRLIHKPADLAAARGQLRDLSGREHFLIAGLAVAIGGAVVWRHVDAATLRMRDLSDAFLDAYIAAEGALLLGGVYRIEGRGIQLFASVDGHHSTIIGLPLLPLLGYLREIGWLRS